MFFLSLYSIFNLFPHRPRMSLLRVLRLFLPALLLLCGLTASAQDLIIRTNNDTLRAKVLDMGPTKIKYRIGNAKSAPVLEIYKNEVKEIIFESGSRLVVVYNRYEVPQELFVEERKAAFKVDFLSSLFNHYVIGYERKWKNETNLEFKAGYIGPGISTAIREGRGYIVKAGIKFVWPEEQIMKGLRFTNAFNGKYLRPEIIFNQYSQSDESYPNRLYFTNAVINLCFGRQHVFRNKILLDYYAGFGYGWQSNNYRSTSTYDRDVVDLNYVYSHIFLGRNLPLVVSGGMMIGFCF